MALSSHSSSGVYKDRLHLYILTEFGAGGDLLDLRDERSKVFSQDSPRGSSSMFYSACVAEALHYLHRHIIIHRDVKAEKAILDVRGYAKLCDFGRARMVNNKTCTLIGTPMYMAPEMIDPPHHHDFRVDWWSLGTVTFELLTAKQPWGDGPVSLASIRRAQNTGLRSRHLSKLPTAAAFVGGLLTVGPQNRLGANGAAEIRQHPWFHSFDFSALAALTLESPWSQRRQPRVITCSTGHVCVSDVSVWGASM